MLNNTRQPHNTTRPAIGLLIHNIDRFAQPIFSGIVDAAHEQDVNLLCVEGGALCSPFSGQGNVAYEMVPGTIEGFIFWGAGSFNHVSHAEFTRFCQRYSPCPMVTIGGKAVEGVPNVFTKSSQGVSRVVTHLIQCHGCRRIAYIHGEYVEAPARYQGYVDALADHGIPLDPALVVGHNASVSVEEHGTMVINELLDEHRLSPPDDVEAIVAVSDVLAIGALKALQQRGFRVPEDIAVAGFDDHAQAAITTPPLTTAHQPLYETGRQAVVALLRMLRGEEVPAVIEVSVPLVVRESCGCYSSSVSMAAAPKGPVYAGRRDSPLRIVPAGEIIAELERAPEFSGQTPAADWMRQLVEGFLADVRDDSPDIFLNTLNQIITTRVMPATDAAHEVADLHNMITRLRQTLLPYYAADSSERGPAEHLWQQARILIGEAQGRTRAQSAFEVELQTEFIQNFGRSLITTFDIQDLKEILAQRLPGMGIQSCALALYEDPQPYAYPQPAPEWSQVLLAYDEQGQRDVTSPACRFLSRQFFPAHLLPHGRRYTLIAEPLYFREDQIGFMVLEMGPRKGAIYALLRSQISSALQGALLVQRVQEHSAEIVRSNAEIARQKYILDTFMASVPDSIYFKDRESRITHANLAHAHSFGLSDPSEELGKTDFDFFPEDQARPKYEQEQEIMRSGEPMLALEEPTGEGRWSLTTKMPLRDEHGDIIGTFGISRDITELKQAQKALEQAYSEISTLNVQLQKENVRMGAELDVAKRLQQMVLPAPNELQQIPGLDIAGFMQPADEVGGDYYDVLAKNGVLHVGIGDVTGHGLESGVLMLMTQTVIRTLIEYGEADPVVFVNTLNRTIYKNVQRMGADKTLTFALINYEDHQLKIVGQHEELLVVRQGGKIERMDTVNLGFPIGLEIEISQWVNMATVSLHPGEGVVLYTDGITEAENEHKDLYGLERLCEVVSRCWDQSVERIKQTVIDDVLRHIGEHQIYDDITLVIMKQQ